MSNGINETVYQVELIHSCVAKHVQTCSPLSVKCTRRVIYACGLVLTWFSPCFSFIQNVCFGRACHPKIVLSSHVLLSSVVMLFGPPIFYLQNPVFLLT